MASVPKTSSADREGGTKKCWLDTGIVGKSLEVWPDWPIPVRAWTAPGVSKTQSPTEQACAMWPEFPRKSTQEKSDPETFISQQILHHTLSTLHSVKLLLNPKWLVPVPPPMAVCGCKEKEALWILQSLPTQGPEGQSLSFGWLDMTVVCLLRARVCYI